MRLGIYLDLDAGSHFDDLLTDQSLLRELEFMVADESHFETKRFDSALDFGLFRIAIYCIVRAAQPEIFVETGVLHGLTSTYILKALDVNGAGTLISIDYPSYYKSGPANKDGFYATLPPGREPGWVIPEQYRHRWLCHLGRSSDILPKVLEADRPDIFCHDSEHTYGTMELEMQLTWPRLPQGGILICDNIDCNTSFFDLCLQVRQVPFVLPDLGISVSRKIRFGIIRKP